MAKKSRIERENTLAKKVANSRSRRSELSRLLICLETKKRKSVNDNIVASQSTKEIFKIMNFLQRTRVKSRCRSRNRCAITGRTRGYLGMFGLSRGALRHYASFCLINGVKKSSHS